MSVDAVGAAQIQNGNAQVGVSEDLDRYVPGVVAHSRQNYAQDVQALHARLRR